jgi:hypothetical protein
MLFLVIIFDMTPKAQATKAIFLNGTNCIKLKSFCTATEKKMNKAKRQATE